MVLTCRKQEEDDEEEEGRGSEDCSAATFNQSINPIGHEGKTCAKRIPMSVSGIL
jgi:hypothetical protein